MPDGVPSETAGNIDTSLQEPSSSSQQAAKAPKKKKEFTRIEPTTPEQLVQEDLINNCAVKTVISGIMGSALGVFFGIFMGAMDSAVRLPLKQSPMY